MMYPEELVAPMRVDLTSVGFTEMKTPAQVDEVLKKQDVSLVVVNSVCGCAAGMARPAVKIALQRSEKIPKNLTTVFAGVDTEATAQARKYMLPYPPSSPSIALFKEGKLVHFIERHQIEGKSAEMVAENLSAAFEEFC